MLGLLPNDVTSFNVSGPDVNYNFQQTNVMYNYAWQQGSTYVCTPIEAALGGNYTFNLQGARGNDNYVKNLTPAVIPIVDQGSLIPANNAYLTNLTPTFSRNTVGGSNYYRIFVMDRRLRFVIYASTRSTSLSCTIPAGFLTAGRSYMWRVEVYDESSANADNRSTSGWNCLTTLSEFDRAGMTDFNGDEMI